MAPSDPAAPDVVRRHTARALARYWPAGAPAVERLPIPCASFPPVEPLPPRLFLIPLPAWGRAAGADGALLVPEAAVTPGAGEPWTRVDWWGAAFWHLNGAAERAFEARRGPVHSYAFRLAGWDSRMWDRAWVNRIGLFLRRWAAREAGADEAVACGPLPVAEILLTHDVDAMRKTIALRIKQSAFHAYNAVRQALRGRVGASASKLAEAVRFFFSRGDYGDLAGLAALEAERGLRSHFNVYGGRGGWRRSPTQMLFDPAYRADEPELAAVLRKLRADGWTVGLHPSFHAWGCAGRIREERERLEQALGGAVTGARQHWLRFSWARTWRAQQEAGLSLDTTLGFNDRPGFRNGAALRFHPWDPVAGRPLDLEAVPLVLMDSHLYDYAVLDTASRARRMAAWVDEVRATRGEATVLWHPHSMSPDLGRADGCRMLLDLLSIGGA